jgi:type IV secretory pathway VirB10-like protein
MKRTMLIVLAVLAAGACRGGEQKQAAANTDSLSRDLQLAPVDSSKPLHDVPADTAAPAPAPEPAPPPAAKPTAPRPKPKARRAEPRVAEAAPSPTAAPAPAPAPPAGPLALAAGTAITATMNDSISSRKNKVGDVVTARVSNDLTGPDGRVVVPAGSTVAIKITAIHESENKGDKTGTLTLAVQDISVNGRTYAIDATVDQVARELVGRKTNAGDIAKVGAGTGIGAIVGRVIGGGTGGAVVGGVIGGAVGAQRAVETKDRDVVVAAGSKIQLTLREKLEVAEK